jgi:hypothetical protein
MKQPGRILICPRCGGKLLYNRHPYVTSYGVIVREKMCLNCKIYIYTEQSIEKIESIQKIA